MKETPLRRVMKIVAVTSVAALALAACGSSDDTSSSGSTPSSTKSALKVGLAYDIGGRGDQSFNDAAAAGLDKAKSDLGVTAQEAEATTGETESAKEDRLRTLAQAGYNPVIAVGFAYAGAVDKVAAEFPDTKFAIVDERQGRQDPGQRDQPAVRRERGLVPGRRRSPRRSPRPATSASSVASRCR